MKNPYHGLVSVVIPLYRSETTIGPLVDRVVEVLRPRCDRFEVILVNDGSPDGTHQAATSLVHRYPGTVRYFRLSRNFGEHNAVMCGLNQARGDAVTVIDDDFQNPPDEILILLDKLREGYDVVYSRYSVKHHSWFRNLGSRFTNRVASVMLSKPRDLYLSSFKMMNAFTVRTITRYRGPFPYIDGLILRSTSSITSVLTRHAPRSQGRSNYTLRRLVHLWLDMFTGFSIAPLRLASALGILMSGIGFLMAVFFILSWWLGGIFFRQPIPPGWASLIVTVIFFGGVQLCLLGVLGEYLGRLLLTQNRAPQYVIRDVLNAEVEEEATHD